MLHLWPQCSPLYHSLCMVTPDHFSNLLCNVAFALAIILAKRLLPRKPQLLHVSTQVSPYLRNLFWPHFLNNSLASTQGFLCYHVPPLLFFQKHLSSSDWIIYYQFVVFLYCNVRYQSRRISGLPTVDFPKLITWHCPQWEHDKYVLRIFLAFWWKLFCSRRKCAHILRYKWCWEPEKEVPVGIGPVSKSLWDPNE